MVSVASWAHRALRGISRYHDARDEPEYCQRLGSHGTELVIGVYENPPGVEPSTIAITERGLYWASAGANQCVEFASLGAARTSDEKTVAAEVKMVLLDGSERVIRVEGGEGRYRDAHSMIRFLDRVMDLKRNER
jgi:hypothetical protein